jgi:hypothetical protein
MALSVELRMGTSDEDLRLQHRVRVREIERLAELCLRASRAHHAGARPTRDHLGADEDASAMEG